VNTRSLYFAPSFQSIHRIRYFLRPAFLVSSLVVVAVCTAFWLYTTLGLAANWEYQVYANNLDEVSALAFDNDNGLYATLEKRNGQGQLVYIKKNKTIKLLDGMEKPDGMLRRGERLYITNESGDQGLLEYKLGVLRAIDGVFQAEGISSTGSGRLLVVEDRNQDGRLLRIDEQSGKIEVLLTNLKEPEGVCQGDNGDIYIAEKTKHHLTRYQNGHLSVVCEGLDKPAFLNCLDDGSILITEDKTNTGRLLRCNQDNLEVIVSRLHSPQSVIVDKDGSLYLAEQRRKRILKVYRRHL